MHFISKNIEMICQNAGMIFKEYSLGKIVLYCGEQKQCRNDKENSSNGNGRLPHQEK